MAHTQGGSLKLEVSSPSPSAQASSSSTRTYAGVMGLLLLLSVGSLMVVSKTLVVIPRGEPHLVMARSDALRSISPNTDTTGKAASPTVAPTTEGTDVSIPQIIHQSWKSTDGIPARFAPWMRSWVALHPDWQYVFWDDSDNLAIFERFYPRYASIARAMSKIALADMARYALLHRYGGLYVDADFESLHSFEQLHRDHTIFLSSEPIAHTVLLEHSTTAALCNAIMASAPGHVFWLRVLESIKEKYDRKETTDVVSLTGPRIVKYTYEQFFRGDADVAVLPSEYFYPEIAYWNIGNMRATCKSRADDAVVVKACEWLDQFPHGEFTTHTHATHHWQCTWCLGEGQSEHTSLKAIFNDTRIYRPTFEEYAFLSYEA